MRNKKEITTKVISEIICDKCGEQFPHETDGISIDYTFGYHSKRDMDRIAVDICEDCFEDMLGETLMNKALQNAEENEIDL